MSAAYRSYNPLDPLGTGFFRGEVNVDGTVYATSKPTVVGSSHGDRFLSRFVGNRAFSLGRLPEGRRGHENLTFGFNCFEINTRTLGTRYLVKIETGCFILSKARRRCRQSRVSIGVFNQSA